MPRIKKVLPPLNLIEYDVYIEDMSTMSDYFNVTNLPPSFTGGRNSFLIGGSTFLEENSTVQIEILDADGKTIYQTSVPNYYQGQSLLISVEVYDTTVSGFSTIVIMGKATTTANGEEIPSEWKGVYNVRWTKKILTDYNSKNSSPIIFKNTPAVAVEEKRFFNINSSSYDVITTPFTASLRPQLLAAIQVGYNITAEAPTTFSRLYENGVITGSLTIGTDTSTDINLPLIQILSNKTAFTTGSLIKSSINDGIIKRLYLKSGSYSSPFDSIEYPVTTSALLQYSVVSTSSTNIPISYASLRLSNLSTVSGEIYKLRVYNKVAIDKSDYKIIGDAYISTGEILVSGSEIGDLPIGDVYICRNYTENWYAGKIEKNNDSIKNPIYSLSGSAEYYNPTYQYAISSSDSTLLSSIYAGIPVDTLTNKFSQISESGYFIGTKQAYTVFPTTEYTLTFNAYYKQTSASITLEGNEPRVDIYLIGSGSSKIINLNPLGQRIGQLIPTRNVQRLNQQQFNFSPAISEFGPVYLRFVVTNGFWRFSNISIKPASDAQFSPDEAFLLIPNTEYCNELLQYKVEFFDINNNSSTLNAISIPTFFTGSNIDLGTLS